MIRALVAMRCPLSLAAASESLVTRCARGQPVCVSHGGVNKLIHSFCLLPFALERRDVLFEDFVPFTFLLLFCCHEAAPRHSMIAIV